MSVETALGTKGKCEVRNNRIGVHKKPTRTVKFYQTEGVVSKMNGLD